MKRTLFEQALRDALSSLYDPSYQPDTILYEALGLQENSSREILAALRQAVIDMKPGPTVPANARVWRFYHLLDYRYLQGLTQEEAAQRLGITPRHLRREQQEAIKSLAQQIWPQQASRPATEKQAEKQTGAEATWLEQMHEEVAILKQSAPATVAHLQEVIEGIRPLAETLATKYGIRFRVHPASSNAMIALHPTLLRQLLLTVVEKLVAQMDGGEIVLETVEEEERVGIFMRTRDSQAPIRLASEFVQELMGDLGNSIIVDSAGEKTVVRLYVPKARPVRVLVVDDNADLMHFYRRYVTNTRFEITPLSSGRELFATIDAVHPDVIVLDVMLPDMDGWELLTYLHEHPDTRRLPVIICSVVRRKELALALGATLYLPKPVRRKAFIDALEQVTREAHGEVVQTGPESSSSDR
jgi:CheY-like chemotaxis protein